MDCKHCGKPIVLVPSATERAAKFGGEAREYTRLFTYHAECTLKVRAEGTTELIRRLRMKGA